MDHEIINFLFSTTTTNFRAAPPQPQPLGRIPPTPFLGIIPSVKIEVFRKLRQSIEFATREVRL
jgi:hypothetical protein